MTAFIDRHRDAFGVEPICRTPEITPSTCCAARTRPPSARAVRDEELKADISRLHTADTDVHGVRETWHQLLREGIDVGRDRVGRLMDDPVLHGASRSRRVRTTSPAAVAERPADLVDRVFSAAAPDRPWVADLTCVRTRSGLCCASFVIDTLSRRIVGWLVSPSLRTDLALDALEMAIFTRGDRALAGLVHHSDRGTRCLSIRYTERLAEAGVVSSVGSRGDSFDNALAETVDGLDRAKLIHRRGPWRTVEDVELATSAWVHWWNTSRLHGACGDVPPVEYEAAYWATRQATIAA